MNESEFKDKFLECFNKLADEKYIDNIHTLCKEIVSDKVAPAALNHLVKNIDMLTEHFLGDESQSVREKVITEFIRYSVALFIKLFEEHSENMLLNIKLVSSQGEVDIKESRDKSFAKEERIRAEGAGELLKKIGIKIHKQTDLITERCQKLIQESAYSAKKILEEEAEFLNSLKDDTQLSVIKATLISYIEITKDIFNTLTENENLQIKVEKIDKKHLH